MKTLVIAEKPKVAQTFVEVIKKQEPVHKEGLAYKSEHYEVFALSGHIFELYDLEEYDPNYKKGDKIPWTLDNLPFFPSQFQYKLIEKTSHGIPCSSIFNGICNAMKHCDQIIHLGDSDIEGQYLVDLVLMFAKNDKPTYRLWQDSNTVEEMQKALHQLIPNSEYKHLSQAGYLRACDDWLFGINGSRLLTIKAGGYGALPVGRVITAITKEIYDRDMEINNFQPKKYYQPFSDLDIKLLSKNKFETMEKAQQLCDYYNSQGAVVIKKETKETEIKARKLFDLNHLQAVCSKKFGYSPLETLNYTQKLYEGGMVSYPRTETEYLKTDEINKVEAVIEKFSGDYDLAMKTNKSIFNDDKVAGHSHSALVPTGNFNNDIINEQLKNVFGVILSRFLAVFCAKKCLVDRTKIQIQCAEEIFNLSGDIYKQAGWKVYEKVKMDDKTLPNINVGDKIPINFLPAEKQTAPPAHYSTTTLLQFLTNPFGNDEESETDDEVYKNVRAGATIGKASTRGAIIKKGIDHQYFTFDKKSDTYRIAPIGTYVIESLHTMGIDVTKEKTVQSGVMQKQVETGQMTTTDALAVSRKNVEEMFRGKNVSIKQRELSDIKCPFCGKDVVETQKSFRCLNGDFVIAKNNKFFTNKHKKVTKPLIKKLLTQGYCDLKNCISSNNKKYDVRIFLKKDNNDPSKIDSNNQPFVNFEMEFLNSTKKPKKKIKQD